MEIGAYASYGYQFNPFHATKEEMRAFCQEQDELRGTEGSYEKLMKYADTAKKNGRWDENETVHNWNDLITDVWADCEHLGLEKPMADCMELYDAMCAVSARNFNFKEARAVDMQSQTMSKIAWPDVPVDIASTVTSFVFNNDNVGKFGLDRMNRIWTEISRRIERALNENGGRASADMSWDTAISTVEGILEELGDYFGEELANDLSVKKDVQEMKDLYRNIIKELKTAKENRAEDAVSDVADGEEDGFGGIVEVYMAELCRKVLSGDTEEKFDIGSISLTVKEWEKILDEIDELEEEIKAQIKAELDRRDAERVSESEKDEQIKPDEAELLTSEKVVKSTFKEATSKEPEISYVTCFTAQGIVCKGRGQLGEAYEWKLDYRAEGDYEKVMAMLGNFPSDWNLRFASSENFWNDYLDGKIDPEDFVSHMNKFTEKGNPNYLIEKNGSTYVNREAVKYSRYLNDPRSKMYTLGEFTDMIAQQMDVNRRRYGRRI